MSCDDDALFPLGSLAVITHGKCAGEICAVIGSSGKLNYGSALLVANGRTIGAKKPKRKNPKHLRSLPGRIVSTEIVQRLARGKVLDDGWLIEAIRRLNEIDSQLRPKEVGSFEWQKTMSSR